MEENKKWRRADGIAMTSVMLVSAVLLSALLGAARELSNRSYCAANCRGIMHSMVIYAADNNDEFPCVQSTSATKYDVSLKNPPGKKTPDETLNLYYDKDQPCANNPTANLWILSLKGQLHPKELVCKSDPFAGESAELTNPDDHSFNTNITSPKNISYSTAYPWTLAKGAPPPQGHAGDIITGGHWKNTSNAGIAIVSDMAPFLSSKGKQEDLIPLPSTAPAPKGPNAPIVIDDGTSATPPQISPNHQAEGQNVGYADGHAFFERRPDVGQNNDNIFLQTVKDKEVPIDAGELPEPAQLSAEPFDIVMVPTRSAKGDLK